VASTRSGLRDGGFVVWRGPLRDNASSQVLAPGQAADDAFLRGMRFHVDGVEGHVPS
jgi:basic membrane protein A